MMDRACKNCRFCIYTHSMRDKEEPYCERHRKLIGNTLLCSEWEMVSVPKPQTNYDRIRAMTVEELAEWLAEVLFHCSNTICDERCPMYKCCCDQPSDNIEDWLKQEYFDNKIGEPITIKPGDVQLSDKVFPDGLI